MRIGELFSGYGGLGMGVQAAMGGDVVWHSDIDPGACKILAHRYPGVPNLGDVARVDWSAVEPVDVLTGGTPCQDLSHAGKRGGMTEGTRSNLWVAMREAIAALRPPVVVWENVRGALSVSADSELESREGRLGMRPDGPVLRALGRVLGDLATLGYDAGWHGLRAADVGSPHGRFRVFVIAHPRRSGLQRRVNVDPLGAVEGGPQQDASPVGCATLTCGAPGDGDSTGPERAGAGGSARALVRLLPTPTSMDALGSRNSTAWRSDPAKPVNIGDTLTDFAWKHDGHVDPRLGQPTEPMQDWGEYAAAIARWETLTRPAPPPTQPSRKGTPQLSPRFSEWLMGLPDGWVTDVPGITRNEALRALGNGVVPQQAAAALRFLLSVQEVPA